MKNNRVERILGTIEERDGVGVTVAVIASELRYERDFVADLLNTICVTLPFKLMKMTEGDLVAYRWKEGKQREKICACGHPWWQHEGSPGTECIAERCNCGLFRDDTKQTETCMTTESELERDLALAYITVLLGTPKVIVHFEGRLGWGRVPVKTIEFESAKPDSKARCIAMLKVEQRYCEILLAEITNREDEKPKATTAADDPDQTDIEEAILDSNPDHAVIVWNPDKKDEQKEVVAVTVIDNSVFLVRHLANGSSQTLFQGTTWADLVDEVRAKHHRLEPMPSVEGTVGPEPEAAAPEPAALQPPADVAATGPVSTAGN